MRKTRNNCGVCTDSSPFLSAVVDSLPNMNQQVFLNILCMNRKTNKQKNPWNQQHQIIESLTGSHFQLFPSLENVFTSQEKDVNKCHLTLALQLHNGFGRTFPTPPTPASVWAICEISKLWKWARVEGKRETQKRKAVVDFFNIFFSVTIER